MIRLWFKLFMSNWYSSVCSTDNNVWRSNITLILYIKGFWCSFVVNGSIQCTVRAQYLQLQLHIYTIKYCFIAQRGHLCYVDLLLGSNIYVHVHLSFMRCLNESGSTIHWRLREKFLIREEWFGNVTLWLMVSLFFEYMALHMPFYILGKSF